MHLQDRNVRAPLDLFHRTYHSLLRSTGEIQIQALVDLDLPRTDIGGLRHPAAAELFLETQVPRRDVSAHYFVWQRADCIGSRYRDAAGAYVRHLDRGDAALELGGGAISGDRRVDGQQQIRRVVGEHVADEGQRIRIVVDTEAGPDDGGFGGAIGTGTGTTA